MFLFSQPDEARIRTILSRQRAQGFSYSAVGASRGEPPAGYDVIHDRADLGRGGSTFTRAVEGLRRWEMFLIPGIQLCWPNAAIEPGSAVAVLIRHLGFWSLNFCKIVYVLDQDEGGPVRRYGFAYGTLAEHAEKGEERFLIEWDRASDVISYDILSFSRPGHVMTWQGYPVARWLQRRFVRDSLAAMVEAVRGADQSARSS